MRLPALEKAKGGTGRRLPKVFGKTVFLRADLDVPLKSQIENRKTQNHNTNRKSKMVIEDDTRLLSWVPTLKFLLDNGARVIIGGHFGRPNGFDKSLSLEPVVYWLQGHLERSEISQWDFSSSSAPRNDKNTVTETKIDGFDGWEITPKLFLLENLRFYKGEETNDQDFAKKLASLADIYVNDAFAVCHRAHASIVGVPKYLPHFAGLHLQEEARVLSGILENPKRPLVVIIGGAKIETKLPLVEKMRDFADYVLVGGKIAKEITPFLKAQHQTVKNRKEALLVADLNPDGLDITPKSVDDFLQIINTAKTVVWNGPVGLVQSSILRLRPGQEFNPSTSSGLTLSGVERVKVQSSGVDTERGTRELAKGIVRSKAYTVVGGGDTVAFLKRLGVLDKFSFVSTGGGAMLEFLSGKELPGLTALILKHTI